MNFRFLANLLPSKDLLNLFATMLAAVSAISSAYIAHNQQVATFTSILYNKQIDEASNFINICLEESKNYQLKFNKNFPVQVTFESIAELNELSDKMSSSLRLVFPSSDKLKLVAPQSYYPAISNIQHDFLSITMYFKKISIAVDYHKLDKSTKIDDVEGLRENLNKLVDPTNKLVKNILDFKHCMQDQFREGHPLQFDGAKSCVDHEIKQEEIQDYLD